MRTTLVPRLAIRHARLIIAATIFCALVSAGALSGFRRAAADAYAAQLRRSKPQGSGLGNRVSGLDQERGTRNQA